MIERLEELLVARGLLSQERADDALRSQALVGGAMDTLLLEMGALREQDLVTALGEVSGLQPIYLADYVPNPAMASALPREDAERLNIAPLSVEDEMLHVAVAFPVPMRGLEVLVRKLGRSVAPWVSTDVRVRAWRSQIYGGPLPARDAALLGTLGPTLEERLATEMAEQAAKAVVGEPVPLVNPRPEAQPPPGSPETLPAAAESASSLLEALEAGVAAAEPELPSWQPESPRARTQRRARDAAKEDARGRESVVDWTLTEARTALRAVAGDREGLKDVVLRYARRTFDFVAAFAVVRGAAMGWDAQGERAEEVSIQQVSFPLDAPSVFRTATLAHSCYAGPVPGDALTRQVLGSLGRSPRSVFVFPVEVRGRLVAILYGDRGERAVSQRRLSELILFCQDLGQAFAELIVLRKQRRFSEDDRPAEPTGVLGLDGAVRRTPETLDRAPPPAALGDLGPVLERLVGSDAAARAAAISELTRAPESAARALSAQFPGPSAWSRVSVQELPAPDELGPVPAGLARLGAAGARALVRFLDAPEADVRYVALLTAGSLAHPELVPGVLRGLFDPEPDVSSAARAAATALRRLPRFQAALPDLRQELVAKEPERRVLAARALGMLHDRASVEGLIGLTASDDAPSAQAAAEALIEITRASFGTSAHAWMAWWAENKARRRVQWLLAALRNPEPWLRSVAVEELAGALGDTLGYSPDALEPERARAIARWEEALLDPRLRTIDS
ncbi:MAG TPA: FrgA protein [Myxococcaceae bacterium]|nr:FrgA protein [Myxococcaceae bacterium]